MSTKFFAFFISVILLSFTYGQVITPLCRLDSDCNNIFDWFSKRCSNEVCVKYGEKAYKGQPAADQLCKGSFLFNNGIILGKSCGSFATVGCVIPIAEIQWRKCLAGSRDNAGKCTAATVITPGYAPLHARCDSTVIPQELCASDQVCLRNVCRKKLRVGEACRSSDIPCVGDLICDEGICAHVNSKNDEERCNSNSVCKSGSCANNRCAPSKAVECFSNSDCGSLVCKKPAATSTTDEPGTCFNPLIAANAAYYKCHYEKCALAALTTNFNSKCNAADKCATSFVRKTCAQICMKKAEERFFSGSQWIFDCRALTKTEMVKGTDCEVTEQFLNCEEVINYSSANGLRGVSTWISIQFLGAFALVMLFI